MVRYLFHTLNIVLSCLLFKIFQGWRNKSNHSWVQLTKIWWGTGQRATVNALDNALSDKKLQSIRLELFLWTCIRLLCNGENDLSLCQLKTKIMENNFNQFQGRREEKARLHRKLLEVIDCPNTTQPPPTMNLTIVMMRLAVEDVEDRAFSRRQNKELGFLFATRRTRSGRLVRTSNRAVLYSNFFYNM